MDKEKIKELIGLVSGTDIIELTVESDGHRVTIRRSDPARRVSVNPSSSGVSTPVGNAGGSVGSAEDGSASEVQDGQVRITSPFVGTFYRAPSPEAPSFVEEGAEFKKGQTLCLIEAMKLMNEVEADFDGKILEILMENGEAVEYGQPLFLVERL